jgi:hypothetical protein
MARWMLATASSASAVEAALFGAGPRGILTSV